MHNTGETTVLIDRYLRNELLADEEAAFEAQLLESPHLQLQLETAMAIRQALLRAGETPVADETKALPAVDSAQRLATAGAGGECGIGRVQHDDVLEGE